MASCLIYFPANTCYLVFYCIRTLSSLRLNKPFIIEKACFIKVSAPAKKGSTSNVVFVHFIKLQLLYPIFSYFSLILDEIEAENVLLKRNGGANSINTFTELKKKEISFFAPNIANIKKIKTEYEKLFTKTVTFVWPRQSNEK